MCYQHDQEGTHEICWTRHEKPQTGDKSLTFFMFNMETIFNTLNFHVSLSTQEKWIWTSHIDSNLFLNAEWTVFRKGKCFRFVKHSGFSSF